PRGGDPGGHRIGSGLAVCVFDLDHTLVDSPLDLRAVGRDMEAFLRERGINVPARALRWSGAELFDLVRREAIHLEAELLAIPVAHERRAMAEATLIPFAREALAAVKQLGFATAIWTNNDRVVADFVLSRFDLLPHLDLVVTRDASRIVVVGDSWVDGLAAQAAGVPFIAYRPDLAQMAERGVAMAARIGSLLDLPAALAD